MRTAENLDRGLWAVAALLIVLWLGMMVWPSYASLLDKDPVPVGEREKREQERWPPRALC